MRKLSIFLLFSLIVIFCSCKKTDSMRDGEAQPVDRFFSAPSSAPKEIKAIAQALKKQNDQFNYLFSITKRAGYPRWDKAIIANYDKGTIAARGSEEASGEFVYIPFVKDSDNHVNSVLAVKMDASDTVYRMIYANNYKAFGYDTSDHSKWSARDVFNIFTSFDYSVFRHTKFWVRDTNLFKPDRDSSYVIVTRVSSTSQSSSARASVYTVAECTAYTVCTYSGTEPGDSGPGTTTSDSGPLIARIAGCSTKDFCTVYTYGDGGGGSTTGTGDGTGASGGSGWYSGGSSEPCTGSTPVERVARLQIDAPCGGWVPISDNQVPQYTTNEQEPGITDADPNLIWWDESISDPNTAYIQQPKPKWDNVYQNYPKNAANDDMPIHDVCVLIGGEVLTQHNSGNANNGCALRTSRALNYSGINIPKIQGQTWQGADGKNYFYRAEHLYNWMTKAFGQPDIHLTAEDGAPDGTKFKDKLVGRGIYIMKPKSAQSFQASGHATLWAGLDCVGGHNYFAAASDVYLWRLPQ